MPFVALQRHEVVVIRAPWRNLKIWKFERVARKPALRKCSGTQGRRGSAPGSASLNRPPFCQVARSKYVRDSRVGDGHEQRDSANFKSTWQRARCVHSTCLDYKYRSFTQKGFRHPRSVQHYCAAFANCKYAERCGDRSPVTITGDESKTSDSSHPTTRVVPEELAAVDQLVATFAQVRPVDIFYKIGNGLVSKQFWCLCLLQEACGAPSRGAALVLARVDVLNRATIT